jgi:flagella basal body P-ring formation protein FlgA
MRTLSSLAAALLVAALPAAALPGLAWAGPPAALRDEVASSGGKVTLGDLFYDAGDASGVVVARVAPGQMAVLDATQVQIIARSNGVDWGNPAGLRRIVVQAGAAPEAAASARRPGKSAPVLAWQHSLNAGDVVRAEDLTWSREAVSGGDSPRDVDAVIGMAARRPVREGDAVSLHDVSTPIVIKKDDVIGVSFTVEGLSLTLQAKALADAAAGQPVSVVNPASKKVIQAVAVGPGQAVVGPEAE